MTAEQFWQYWDDKKWAKPSPEIVKPVCVAFAEAYHRAEPAAQLAEKEREIARLKVAVAVTQPTFEDLTFREAIRSELIVGLNARAEAAEERDALKELLTDMELEHSAALRQREAELEQARTERHGAFVLLREHIADWPIKSMDWLMRVRLLLGIDQPALPSPPKEAKS